MKIIVLLLVCYTLFIHSIGGIALWDPDEPRQALMAREMMERNDYIHPYLNGKPYLEKPPLYSWAIAMAATMRGTVDEFASRIPAALSATLLLLITFCLGTLILDSKGGFLSSLALATNYQFLSNARESVMDMTFAFFIGLSIFIAYLATMKGKRFVFALAFVPCALAILTKGPAGLVIPVFTISIYLLVKKEFRKYFFSLVAGCLLAGAVASIWFLLAGPEYAEEFIIRQNVTRYTNAFDHIEPLSYYFHKLFFNFLPWSLFLPFAVYHGFRKHYWLPLVWFLFTFVFFELSKSKRAIYLLSCYPACALLCGLYLRDRWEWLVGNAWTNTLLKVFALLLSLFPVAAIAALYLLPAPLVTPFKNETVMLFCFLGLFLLGGTISFYFIAKRNEKGALVSLFAYFLVMALSHNILYMPVMDRTFKSPRLITDRLAGFPKDTDIYTYGFSSAGFIFYVGRPIHMFNDIKEVKDQGRDVLLIVEDRPGVNIKKDLDTLFAPVKKARYEKENYTLYVRKYGR